MYEIEYTPQAVEDLKPVGCVSASAGAPARYGRGEFIEIVDIPEKLSLKPASTKLENIPSKDGEYQHGKQENV